MSELSYPDSNTIYRHRLPNGITVLVYENFASESVVIDGLVRAGALAEPPEKAGLASFTAALLMRGTQKRDFDQIYEAMESVGVNLGFGGGRHVTDFSGSGLVEDLDLILDLLVQSLRYPTFPPEQVERMRGQTVTGLQMRAHDTQRMAALAFYDLLYPDHPYGRSTQGYLNTIAAISRADIEAFHRHYYGPQGMIITLVGAVDRQTAVAKIEAVFGDWQNPAQQALPAIPPVSRPAQILRTGVIIPEKSQSDIYIGLPGPPRATPDYLDVSLMNTILGVFGMMGRIGQTVREKQGLAYYAYSHLPGSLGPSPWYAVAGVAPDKVEQAIASIRYEIGRIQNEPVLPEELADSQAYRIGSLPVSLETNNGLAGIIQYMELHQLGMDYLPHYPAIIRAITVERVQAAAQKYLSSDHIAIAVAGSPVDDSQSP